MVSAAAEILRRRQFAFLEHFVCTVKSLKELEEQDTMLLCFNGYFNLSDIIVEGINDKLVDPFFIGKTVKL